MKVAFTKSILSLCPQLAVVACVVVFAGDRCCFAQEESKPAEITPPHVLVHVATVRTELKELRFLMGRPESQQPEMNVTGAAPREVYFQALTMFQKADRLCFEHTRERAAPPPPPSGEIQPANVRDVVDVALTCVRRVKNKYGLKTASAPGERDDSKQPTDVFRSIVQANRQLNLMLERRFAPGDVFQQVTRAIGHTSRLLEQFPDAETRYDEPAYQEGKRPADVYRRLLGCFERIRTIAEQSGLEMLELQIDDSHIESAEPSDVYDVASLIIAELAYLHSKLPGAKPPRNVYDVGRKFPSHVFQRVGILEGQLVSLEVLVKQNSNWLEQGSGD
ncbi:MAG: hypothetical protein H8E66_20790 [Planctomycetes bacterium]|nr:hypothetical protein [Planctomycetota bacterium]